MSQWPHLLAHPVRFMRREPMLFGRRQQRCGLLQTVLQQLITSGRIRPSFIVHAHQPSISPSHGKGQKWPSAWDIGDIDAIMDDMDRKFLKVMFPESTICILYSLQSKAIHTGSVPGTITFISQSATILDASLYYT